MRNINNQVKSRSKKMGRPSVNNGEVMRVKTIRFSVTNLEQAKQLAAELNKVVGRNISEDEAIRFALTRAADEVTSNADEVTKTFKEIYEGDKHKF